MDSPRDAALAFLDAGLQPVPIADDGSKHPPFAWSALRRERATTAIVDGWFRGHPGRGVGIVCGSISGDLVAIDADVSGERPGWPLLEAAVAGIGGELAAGWERAKAGWLDETPSGGRHVLVRIPGADIGNAKLAAPRNGGVYVETRGEGGLVVCPPSSGSVHPTGRPYAMVAGGPSSIATLSLDWWQAFVEACDTFDERTDPSLDATPRGPTWTGNGSDTRPGADFNRRTDWRSLLEDRGFTVTRHHHDRLRFRRPGKTEGESGTVFLHAGMDGCGLLKMWSTGVPGLEGEGVYSPFGFYAALSHGGDHRAAARELGRLGYGEQRVPSPFVTITTDWSGSGPVPSHNGATHDMSATAAADLAAPSHPANVRPIRGDAVPPAEGEDIEAVVQAGDVKVRVTDTGNADRLADRIRGRFAWVEQRNGWYRHDGTVWRPSTKREVYEEARASVEELWPLVPMVAGKDERKALGRHVSQSEGQRRIEAAVSLCRSRPGIPVDDDELDADPHLLNAANGTIDLRAGTLRPHRPGDLITKKAAAAFDPGAQAPTWQAFLSRILPDPDVRSFVQEVLGYGIAGLTTQMIPIAWGRGANGKSTLVDTVMSVLGDYAIQSPIETFMQDRRDSGGPSPELARLQGSRLVFASEGGAGQRLNVGRLKMLTGGERIAARRLYADTVEFEPTHTVWLSTNHRPIVPGDDPALWRRVRLVPFTQVIPESEQDPALRDRLLAEAPGILAWLVEGHARVAASGGRIAAPAAVLAATAEYRSDNDEIGEFILARCIEEPRARATAKELYDAYKAWVIETQGDAAEPVKVRTFGLNLLQRGFDKDHTRGGAVYRGVRLRQAGDGASDREAF